MNTREAIKILRREGYKVEVVNRKSYNVTSRGYTHTYNGRGLVNLARIWTSEGQRTPVKGNLKWADKHKNRSATKLAINNGDFDKIPQRSKVKQDDIWNWD